MSVFLKYLMIVLFCFSALSYAQDANKVFKYRIELTEVPVEDGAGASRVVAQVLGEIQSGQGLKDCIDLRTLGLHASDVIHSGTVGVLMNERISAEALDEVKDRLCGVWYKRAFSDCDVNVEVEEINLDQTQIVARGFAPHDHKPHPELDVTRSPSPNQRLPRFSEGCKTGSYQDSWNNAASTSESRKYLRGLGIDLDQTRTLDLSQRDGTGVWSFGFPRRDQATGDDSQSSERRRKVIVFPGGGSTEGESGQQSAQD